jgi:hypothetical protein
MVERAILSSGWAQKASRHVGSWCLWVRTRSGGRGGHCGMFRRSFWPRGLRWELKEDGEVWFRLDSDLSLRGGRRRSRRRYYPSGLRRRFGMRGGCAVVSSSFVWSIMVVRRVEIAPVGLKISVSWNEAVSSPVFARVRRNDLQLRVDSTLPS